MVTRAETDIQQIWKDYRAMPTVELRNRLLEHYLPLVKYNAERIWSRLPDGVENLLAGFRANLVGLLQRPRYGRDGNAR